MVLALEFAIARPFASRFRHALSAYQAIPAIATIATAMAIPMPTQAPLLIVVLDVMTVGCGAVEVALDADAVLDRDEETVEVVRSVLYACVGKTVELDATELACVEVD